MDCDRLRTITRLLDEAAALTASDTYWLTRDERDMFERLFDELKRELRGTYMKKGGL